MAAVDFGGVSYAGGFEGAGRAFCKLIGLAAFTVLLLAMSALAPLTVGGILHHASMPGDIARAMSAGDWVTACALVPSMSDWHVPALVALPLCLLAYVLSSGVWDITARWYRTRRLLAYLERSPSLRQAQGRLFVLRSRGSNTSHKPSWEQLVRRTGLAGKVDLVEVDRPLAFCYGWLSPRVCISTGTLAVMDDRELEALLLHERYHSLRRDPLRNVVSQTLARVFFFLPLVGILQRDFAVRKEIEADRYVLDVQELELGLLGALSKMLICRTASNAAADLGAAGGALAGSTECVDRRLDYLLKGTSPRLALSKRSLWASFMVLGLLALIVIVATWHASSAALAYQHICSFGNCNSTPLVH